MKAAGNLAAGNPGDDSLLIPEHAHRFAGVPLLVDLWNDLVLPAGIRAAWREVITDEDDEQVA